MPLSGLTVKSKSMYKLPVELTASKSYNFYPVLFTFGYIGRHFWIIWVLSTQVTAAGVPTVKLHFYKENSANRTGGTAGLYGTN
jgi:hypothetical protein